MIILTKSQAASVAGETSPGHSLDPVALKDGTFVLNEDVLMDECHKTKWPTLSKLPTRVVDVKEFPTLTA